MSAMRMMDEMDEEMVDARWLAKTRYLSFGFNETLRH